MTNFWHSLPKPFFVLAPMGGVTNAQFRYIVAKYGKPDVIFTEFTNVESLFSDGRDKEITSLEYQDIEHPIVAQLWGIDPKNFERAAELVENLGFDGIDINMGCPARKILARGTCGDLINAPSLACEIIAAAKSGVKNIPVSVKTRIGYSKPDTEYWIGTLLDQDIDTLTIHGRTVKSGYSGTADWNEIGKAVNLRDRMGVETIIIGNGDVKSRAQGEKLVKTYHTDGIMIGRAALQDVFVFRKKKIAATSVRKKLIEILDEHSDMYIDRFGDSKEWVSIKKYFKTYIRDFDGAPKLRDRMMQVDSLDEAKRIVNTLRR
jgi:nifR3 family TIM-barrel protein